MCTVKEIREAIREDCRSQHDMETADIDRIFQTLRFHRGIACWINRPCLSAPTGAGKKNRNRDRHNSFYRSVAFFIP
mgnify:CR=1 FL=1